ncbi:hypothetical protein OCK74_15770 [Chitinophagaceae bacterium LB-8]|uniref:Interferon-induced very large GTPase 1 domain-containing protein n=1 Tax=Paraflavisolibacter caeni TaxID=2982496 RepID=A0A9X2XXV8_9BACT|nr:hypothetical protein [Paraflavisolibacter caeni]MCU7550577.1 hypothetical protein [Paraflavisolibacter caeni]
MDETIYNQLPALKGRFSFLPLLRLWKEVSEGNDTAAAKICTRLCQQFYSIPELLTPTDDYSVLEPHKALIEEAMTTIFPASFSKRKELHAVAMPFASKPIYASSFFRFTYLDSHDNFVLPMDPQVAKNVAAAKIELAYKLILKKWYGIDLIGGSAFICSYPERTQNIHNYFELEWDPQFIDISCSFELPPLPDEFIQKCHHVHDLVLYPQLKQLLPLEHFVFYGLVITRIREVSERETVNIIRTILQKDDCFENTKWQYELKQQIRYFLRMEDADIGFTIFYDAGNEVELPAINYASILLRNIHRVDRVIEFSNILKRELSIRPDYFWWLQSQSEHPSQLDKHLKKEGWKSALITALYHNQNIIGCIEVVTRKGEPIKKEVLIGLEHIKELLQLAVQQNQQQVYNKIRYLVKQHFTAVQSAVEWKFNNAAVRYLLKEHQGHVQEMESVVFENVYPLYGGIDIRNSSGERNKAIQQDLLHQLEWVQKLLERVGQLTSFPLLNEIRSSVHKHLGSVMHFLFAGDEPVIQNFLQKEVVDLMQFIAKTVPEFSSEIEAYFQATASNDHLITIHRQKFEESVTEINNCIAHYIEQEQKAIQEKYPHYFERFVTDGLDFSIYIGQSIAPGLKFNAAHLKNIRLWQLSFLAAAARRVYQLSSSLPVSLQTTQLLLVYNVPISIRFRNDERKFDLDGVHHARYEILKKRIDKAMVKGTGERLTQPGTIAIVYSGDSEVKEYYQYIEHLRKQGLITGPIENCDLEDLQGVSGLKALRVAIQLEETHKRVRYKMKKEQISE